ncbi:MAG: hypothetical protein QG575_2114, partial [Euryarchaeota archaeon]|nr:hypothetical protein [Euryarchaeota archaeon]
MRALVKFVIGFLLITFLVAGSLAVEEKTSKKILILASYNPGLRWTDSIGTEIENQLSIYYPTANFTFEYMDTKKQAPTETRLAELLALYQNKYKNRHFDVIICSDDDAFQFLRSSRDELFPGCPVVFCGVNFFEDKMLAGKKDFTGVVEAFDLPGTLSLMQSLHPDTKQIVMVNDKTATGKANLAVVNQTLSNLKTNISFTIWDNMTVEELQQNASALQEGSLLLLLNYNRDRAGRVLTHEESAWVLRSASAVPIYGTRDVYMGFGVLGGVITTGAVQGRMTADLALRILRGESVDSITVVKTLPESYMFDIMELRRFNISLSEIPLESTIVNQPFQPLVDLSGKNLSGLDLSGVNLKRSMLQNSNLERTNLSGSILEGSQLSDGNLVNANLKGAVMDEIDLDESDLSFADLRDVYLVGADMTGSNLTGA